MCRLTGRHRGKRIKKKKNKYTDLDVIMCTVMPILDPQVGVALSRHCLVQCEQTKAENRCSDNAEFLCEKGYGHTEYS